MTTKNDDNSTTYKASKTDYNNYMKKLKNIIIEGSQSINIESKENIKEFIYNDDFSNIILVINKDNYQNSKNYDVIQHLIPLSIHYQLFSKIDENDIKVTIVFKDAETGDIIDSINYPNDF